MSETRCEVCGYRLYDDEYNALLRRTATVNDDDKKWIAELEKAARVRTPVGATYAVALALMHIASKIEDVASEIRESEKPYDVRPPAAKK